MIPATATRVEHHTASRLNERIHRDMQNRVSAYQRDDRSALISQRLQELDREWDVERALQTNFAILSLVGLTLATRASRRWLVLALGVPAFMVQHGLQGWCPPLPVMRRLGLRTSKEINEERFALKSLRGDFKEAERSDNAQEIVSAVKK